MPRLDASGDFAIASGVGGPVSVKWAGSDQPGEVICPLGSYAQWLDARRWIAVYQSGREDPHWFIETCDLSVRPYRYDRLYDGGCYELAAGAGRWTALIDGGVTGSLGSHAGAGVSLVGTDGRGAAGRDGTLPLILDRQSGSGQQLIAPNGEVTDIGRAQYGLQILGPGAAIWNGGSVGIVPPARLAGGQSGRLVKAADGRRWIVEWLEPHGLVAYPEGSRLGHVLANPAFHHDAVVTPDGRLAVAYSTSVGEPPDGTVIVPDAWELPTVDLSPPAVPIPRINRRCWLGFANFVQPTSLQPGNCSWEVAFGHPTGLVKAGAFIVAQWLDVERDGNTPEAYDAAIRAARVNRPSVPVIAYWPRAVQDGPVPRSDHVGVEAYRLAGESLAAFEARVVKAVMRCKSVALVAQCFSSNESLTKDLASVVPVYASIAKVCPWIQFVLAFSGEGRATGLSDHPEVRPFWKELFDGITGPPSTHIIDPPGDEIVNPKIEVKSYGKTIQRGRDYHAFVGIGSGYEVEVQKDERDSLHFAIYKDGVLLDRSGMDRIVEVKE